MKKGSRIPSIGSISSQVPSSSIEKSAVKGVGFSHSSFLRSGSKAAKKSSVTDVPNEHQRTKQQVKPDKQSRVPQTRSGIPKTASAGRARVEKATGKGSITQDITPFSKEKSEGTSKKGNSTVRQIEASKPASRPLTPNSEVLKEIQAANVLSLSESQLNVLSYNLSEIADKISPSKYSSTQVFQFDPVVEEEESSFRHRLCSFDRTKHSHIKPPYIRKNDETKSAFAKPKIFKTKVETETFPYQPTPKYLSKATEAYGEESCTETGSDGFSPCSPAKLESKDSGYSSSGTWSSFSLDENVKLDLKDEDNQELREIFADLNVREKSSASAYDRGEKQVLPQSIAAKRKMLRGECMNKTLYDVHDRLELLIRGKDDGYNSLDTDEIPVNNSQKPLKSTNCKDDHKLKEDENKTLPKNSLVNGEKSELRKSPFSLNAAGKQPFDDLGEGRRFVPQGKVLKRRSTVTSFRPPRSMEARQNEEGVVSIDEAGYMTCMNDIKTMKTMLLKLKRELQEAEVVSPLSRSYSVSRWSVSPLVAEQTGSPEKVMRRSTYDVGMMREKLRRVRTRSIQKVQDAEDVFKHPLPIAGSPTLSEADKDKKENEALKLELKNMKEKYIQLTKEKDSIAFDKEELEHDLESKNHTIKMLQMQLEKQDNLDEVAYLKRQVKSLTEQVHQQQQKISQLRYHNVSPTSPGGTAVNLMSGQKSSKQEIRVRLRDAFVRHLEESTKSHALLSKQISRTESTISQAQKGLKSLCSSSSTSRCTSCSGTEDTNHCGSDSKVTKDKSSLKNNDPKSHSWTSDAIERIVKTWKDTGRLSQSSSVDNSDSDSSQSVGPGDQIKDVNGPSRLQFL